MTYFKAVNFQARAIFRDKGVLLLMVIAPLLYGLFYPLPYLTDRAEKVPVAIVVKDSGALTQQLTRWMEASPRLLISAVFNDLASAEQAYRNGEIRGWILLYRGWENDFKRSEAIVFPVAGDATSFIVAREAMLGFTEVSGTLSAGIQLQRYRSEGLSRDRAERMRDPIAFESIRPFNPTESYLNTAYISVILIILQQTLWLGFGMSIATQRERGHAFRSAQSMAGALTVVILLYFIHSVILTGPVFNFLNLPLPADRIGALCFLLLLTTVWSLYGLCLCKIFRHRESSPALWVGTSIPILFISGSIWPSEQLPTILQVFAWVFPSTPGIQGLLQLWVSDLPAAALRGVWIPLLAQAAAAVSLIAISLYLNRQVPLACRDGER
ncbi:MAG: ABC transporter permease [Opitutales bacterium]|nr:ABC transporter permease [Opitutales bacterium]